MLHKSFCLLALLTVGVICTPADMHGQNFDETVLYDFCSQPGCADGYPPYGNLIQGGDGDFYGVTNGPDYGEIYKITPQGNYSVLHTFTGTDGGGLFAGLIQGSDGNFYGMTYGYGLYGVGTIFKMTPSGTVTVMHNFAGPDGADPTGNTLVQGTDGNFYGTTPWGGAYSTPGNQVSGGGTIFSITSEGNFTLLYSFSGGSADGGQPAYGLTEDWDGNFYGTTANDGPNDSGTAFKVTPTGELTTIYSFCCVDHAYAGSLSLGADSNFYGVTVDSNTVFRLTPGGTLTVLDTFCSTCATGENPAPFLIQGNDGNYYGTNVNAGSGGGGVVYQTTLDGAVTVLYDFCSTPSCAAGFAPSAGVIQGADGNFYGTTYYGGIVGQSNSDLGDGLIYKLTPSTPLASSPTAPVQVSLSSAAVLSGSSVTLNWEVFNAASVTMRQCYAFVQGNAPGAGNWSGLQTGTIVNKVYQGSATITPDIPGTYTYALTCGGIETGFAKLLVSGNPGSIALITNSPVYSGNTITLDAIVLGEAGSAAPTGSVAFSLGSTTLGSVTLSSGMADLSLETTSIPIGSYTVTATYSGDSQFPKSSTTALVVIQAYPTEISLGISQNPVVQGQNLRLTSTVMRTIGEVVPTGKVMFTSGTTTLGTASLSNGTAMLTLTVPTSIPPGTYPVVATYSGDATDAASTSGAVNVTVQAATRTTLSVSSTTVAYGQSETFTSKVSRVGTSGTATGTVDFYDGSTLLGSSTLNKGVATLTLANNGTSLPAGVYGVTAEYLGDTTDAASESAAVTITVNAAGATTQTTLSASSQIVNQSQEVTLTATVSRTSESGTPTGTVEFYSGTTEIGIAGLLNGVGTITFDTSGLAPGVYPLTAQYTGDANDDPSTSSIVNVTVVATTTTTLVISPNPVPVDHTVSLTATVKQSPGTAYPTGTVTFTVGGMSVGPAQTLSNGTATLNLTDFGIAAGTYPVVASYSGDTNDLPSSATMNVTIQ